MESTCVKNHEARNHNNSTFLHCMPGLAQNCSPPVPRNLPLRINPDDEASMRIQKPPATRRLG